MSRKKTDTPLGGILRTLQAFYGKPKPPAVTGPFEQILLENVAYLANDAARKEAFAELKKRTGLKPARILAAPRAVLHVIASRGITPAATVEKLLEIAAIAQDEFEGNLSGVLAGPPAEARKALRSSLRSAIPAPKRSSSFRALFPSSLSTPTACASCSVWASARRIRATRSPTAPPRPPPRSICPKKWRFS